MQGHVVPGGLPTELFIAWIIVIMMVALALLKMFKPIKGADFATIRVKYYVAHCTMLCFLFLSVSLEKTFNWLASYSEKNKEL